MAATRVRSEGAIELITGPMFAGKTEELIVRLEEATRRGATVLAAKPSIEVRAAPGWLVSHGGKRWPAEDVERSSDLIDLCEGRDVIGLDEAQFLDPALPEVATLLSGRGVRVIIAALDRDFRAEAFGSVPELEDVATSVMRLRARCAVCGKAAELTQRLTGGSPASWDEATIVVGGADIYEARCGTCFVAGGVDRAAESVRPHS